MTPEKIKALRERLQMNQEEFAKHLGFVTRGAVTQLERGTREPKGPVLRLLELLDAQHRPPR